MTGAIIYLAYIAMCLDAWILLVKTGYGGWALLALLMPLLFSFIFTDG
jgi:hypothetical protein